MRFHSPKSIIRLVFAITATVACIASSRAESGENFLPNGGFEEWQKAAGAKVKGVELEDGEAPMGWIAGVSGGLPSEQAMVRLACDSTIKHGGDYSFRLEVPPGVNATAFMRPESSDSWACGTVAVKPGKSYRFKGWIRAENLEPNDGVKAVAGRLVVGEGGNFFGGKNNNRGLSIPIPVECVGSTDWIPIELPFETSSAEVQIFVEFSVLGSGKVWLDDFEIVAGP